MSAADDRKKMHALMAPFLDGLTVDELLQRITDERVRGLVILVTRLAKAEELLRGALNPHTIQDMGAWRRTVEAFLTPSEES